MNSSPVPHSPSCFPAVTRLLAVALIAVLAGCANVAVDRAKVEKLKAVDLVRVETPPVQVLTFMQAWANHPRERGSGSLITIIADGQAQALFWPPAVSDLGLDLSAALVKRLPASAPWWPQMRVQPDTVVKNHHHPSGNWLRIEIEKLEVAPPPLRTLYVAVDVSLRDANNQPLWVAKKTYSGVVHGGQKLYGDALVTDLTPLRREMTRATEWLANEIAATVR